MTAVWVPRDPSPDEPACWSWPIPPVGDLQTEIAREMAASGLDEETVSWYLSGPGDLEFVRFTRFHDGRCAMCGRRPVDGHLVEDHCHETGQVRGYLDRSCNVREGRCGSPEFIRYRRIHPASILGLHMMYTGYGWTAGWSWCADGPESREAEQTGRARPATPWLAWSPEDPLDSPIPRP